MEKSPNAVIDAHAHCGVLDRSVPQSFKDYRQQIAGTDIGGVALFSPVLEVYDRYDFHFTDTDAWQERRRLMFGSDFPFGSPSAEFQKVRSLALEHEVEAAVLGGNFIQLQGIS